MRGALKTVVIVVVAVAVGVGIDLAIRQRRAGDSPSLGSGPTTTATLAPQIVPGANQTFISGTITSLSSSNAEGPALTPPFTITIPVRGQGSADLTGVSVGGHSVEIYWYGGQPLPVSGTGQLMISGGTVSVNASGITWVLDGAARTLTPGHYHLGAPVAVGTSGIATPEQNISFDAGADSTMETTGHAQVHLAPADLHLTGPGSLTMAGTLQVQTPAATRPAGSVTFGPGAYDVTLTPTTGGDTIKATLQGPVTAS
jgi:hypothetical protein